MEAYIIIILLHQVNSKYASMSLVDANFRERGERMQTGGFC